MTPKIITTILALWLCSGVVAYAQATPGRDPLANALVSPDIVMAHQQALGLSEAQRNAIQADAQRAQQRFMSLQWRLAAATEKLLGQLNLSRVDQAKAMSALDAVLNLERQIKHAQLTLMIQVKNELTPEQQAMAHRFAAGTK